MPAYGTPERGVLSHPLLNSRVAPAAPLVPIAGSITRVSNCGGECQLFAVTSKREKPRKSWPILGHYGGSDAMN
jgi:hypothetical protein